MADTARTAQRSDPSRGRSNQSSCASINAPSIETPAPTPRRADTRRGGLMGYCPVTIGSRRPALIVDNRTAYSQFKPVATISKITPSTIISGPYRMARWGSRLHLICDCSDSGLSARLGLWRRAITWFDATWPECQRVHAKASSMTETGTTDRWEYFTRSDSARYCWRSSLLW